MCQYTPRYPKAFGHPAWSLYGFVNDALLQDLFWRKVQTDPGLVARLATILDPNATQENKNIFLSDNTAISLHRGFKFKVQHPVLGYWRLLKKLHRVS